MLPLEVSPSDFAGAMSGLSTFKNCGGVVITIPHKLAAARLASSLSKRVEIAGAANVMRWTEVGWDADLFDGEGFVGALERRGWSPVGRRAAVVGAGGAGLAVTAALLEAGAAEVSLDDIEESRAESAVARLRAHYRERIALGRANLRHDLAVNATPMGMAVSDPVPIDLDALGANALVADVIMKPPKTRLLLEAERRGVNTQPGAPMLDAQLDMIWDFFGVGRQASPAADEAIEK
jgi:shikimate dehydrogenase